MARNGSGVYSLPPGSTVANGDTSDATDVNSPLGDIATDLNTARPVVAGGTGVTSVAAAQTAFKIPPFDGTATITGTWTLNDSILLYFGTGQDAFIGHTGANWTIRNSTGITYFDAGTVSFRNAAGTETTAIFTANGAASLYYDNTSRLVTTSTGAETVGTHVIDGGALNIEDSSNPTINLQNDSGQTQAALYQNTSYNLPTLNLHDTDGTSARAIAVFDDTGATLSYNTSVVTKEKLEGRIYESSNQTITSAGLLTLAHGLGARPRFVQLALYCAVADLGWSIGDVAFVTGYDEQRTNAVWADTTNVAVRFDSEASCFALANKGTGAASFATNTSWRLIVRAWL